MHVHCSRTITTVNYQVAELSLTICNTFIYYEAVVHCLQFIHLMSKGLWPAESSDR